MPRRYRSAATGSLSIGSALRPMIRTLPTAGPLLAGVFVGVAAGGAPASQVPLAHVSSISLGSQFGPGSWNGAFPSSVAFDGASAYIGGWNTTGEVASVGVVRVEGIFSQEPVFTSMEPTRFLANVERGVNGLDFEATTQSLVTSYDSGSAATSFVSRRNASDGALVWTVAGPQGVRPFATGIDPIGDGGTPGVAMLTQGSGRRRLLNLATGATVYDGSTGGIINYVPAPPTSITTWRGVDFDEAGNIALASSTAAGYGIRRDFNTWYGLNGTPGATTRSILKDVDRNFIGQDVAIIRNAEADLLALTVIDAATFTDLLGGVSFVADTAVHLRNLNGTTAGLTQLTLWGDEDGIGVPWDSHQKSLAFARDVNGTGTLLVVDFFGRRLDVYQLPEPAGVLLLAVLGLGTRVRRRRR